MRHGSVIMPWSSVSLYKSAYRNYLKYLSPFTNYSINLKKRPGCVAFYKKGRYCTDRQCSPLRREFMECSINGSALSLLMKQLVIGQRLKTHNFSAFHWSPRGSLVSIGQHFVATRVIHLPESTETSLITESVQTGTNHQLMQL